MNTQAPPSWAVEIQNEAKNADTAQRLIEQLQGMFVAHQGEPAKNQSEWSQLQKQVSAEIKEIARLASNLSRSLSGMCQASENAIYFGHGQRPHDVRTDRDSGIDEWLFLKPLMYNLGMLIDAVEVAERLRRKPAHRPRDFIRDFWIERLIEKFYIYDDSIEISHKQQSLFYRVTSQYLADLDVEEGNLQRTLKRCIESHPFLRR